MREPARSGFAKVTCVLENSTCVDEERAGTEEKKKRFANHLPCQVGRALDVGRPGGGYCALRVYFHTAKARYLQTANRKFWKKTKFSGLKFRFCGL
jgi:hypothetical protein